MKKDFIRAGLETLRRQSRKATLILGLFVAVAASACSMAPKPFPSSLPPDYQPPDYVAAQMAAQAEEERIAMEEAPVQEGGLVTIMRGMVSGGNVVSRSGSGGGIQLRGGSARLPDRWEGFDDGGQGWSYRRDYYNHYNY